MLVLEWPGGGVGRRSYGKYRLFVVSAIGKSSSSLMGPGRIIAGLGVLAVFGGSLWLWLAASDRSGDQPIRRGGGEARPEPDVRVDRAVAAPWVARIAPQTRAARPDILLVVYDARRRDDFSFGPFGNERGDTPFLGDFSRDAVYFEDAVSPGCWTVPVHASMFSGLSVCELGIDYYNPGYNSFSDDFLSLAEILGRAGYHTIAYPDHPFFYNANLPTALIRGFEQFNVVNDFERYGCYTNINTPDGQVEHRYPLDGMERMAWSELEDLIGRFNDGVIRFDLNAEADYDPVNGLYLATLYDMFRQSAYFRKRYGDEFDQYVFAAQHDRPYFLFLNLHMCLVAAPDPGLFPRWLLKTLMLNAQHQGATLALEPAGGGVNECLKHNFQSLGLRHNPRLAPLQAMKQIFDNRFYDACFRAVWEYLEGRGLTGNTVTVVTSDHGLSFGEQGEYLYFHAGARPYEYMTRVPLIIRFPPESELAALHGRYTEKVSLTDVFATLVDLGLGPGVFERALPVRGRSLVDRLRTRDFQQVLVAESSVLPDTYAIRPGAAGYCKAVYTGSLKLICIPEPRAVRGHKTWPATVRVEDTRHEKIDPLALLYDLATDPHESADLAASEPQVIDQLQRLLSGWSCDYRSRTVERPVWDEDALRTLRSLGYLP